MDDYSDNFLQCWGKHLMPIDVKQEISIQGPVGQVLQEFQQEGFEDDELSIHQIEQFEVQRSLYDQCQDHLESIIGRTDRNFAEVINDWVDQREFAENLKVRNHKSEESPDRSLSRRVKKRDLKKTRKQAGYLTLKTKQHMKVVSGNLDENVENSGLVIKIKSGSNVIMDEREVITEVNDKSKGRFRGKKEEKKKGTLKSS